MTVAGFRQLIVFTSLITILAWMIGCEGPSNSSSSSPTRTTNQSPATPSDEDTTDNDGDDSDADDDTDTDPGSEEIISESRALSIMQASCQAADCHVRAEDILAFATVVTRLEDGTMPPTDQSRYTIRSDRRAQLIAFFKDRASGE
ncbi:MAG: hypothetical protein ACOH5I_13635 [Oligoflexus sp.]